MPGILGTMYPADVPNLSLTMSSDEDEVLVDKKTEERNTEVHTGFTATSTEIVKSPVLL